MSKLIECRDKIDQIDTEIIKLFEKRMDVVKLVTEYKIENNMQILDSSREKAMLEKNLGKLTNDDYKKYYHHVLEGFLKASKEMQSDLIDKK